MGLRTLISKAAAGAFKAVGDIAELVTYTHVTGEAYNPTNGTVTSTTTSVSVKAVFSAYGALFGADPNIQKETYSGDLMMTVPAASLGAIVPQMGDIVTRSGKTLRVKGIRSDPTTSVYELLVEKGQA